MQWSEGGKPNGSAPPPANLPGNTPMNSLGNNNPNYQAFPRKLSSAPGKSLRLFAYIEPLLPYQYPSCLISIDIYILFFLNRSFTFLRIICFLSDCFIATRPIAPNSPQGQGQQQQPPPQQVQQVCLFVCYQRNIYSRSLSLYTKYNTARYIYSPIYYSTFVTYDNTPSADNHSVSYKWYVGYKTTSYQTSSIKHVKKCPE